MMIATCRGSRVRSISSRRRRSDMPGVARFSLLITAEEDMDLIAGLLHANEMQFPQGGLAFRTLDREDAEVALPRKRSGRGLDGAGLGPPGDRGDEEAVARRDDGGAAPAVEVLLPG